MRAALDALYRASAWLAALGMVGVLAMVLASILGRQLDFYLPGTDAYAGYAMAAAGFLALAHALRRGDHIRVTVIVNGLGPVARHRLECATRGLAALLGILFAWFSIRLVWQSRLFNDMSTGTDATPLWLPQLSMAIGVTVFAIALVDDWIDTLRGIRRQAGNEPQRVE